MVVQVFLGFSYGFPAGDLLQLVCQVAQLSEEDIAAKYGGEKLEEGLRHWDEVDRGVETPGVFKTWEKTREKHWKIVVLCCLMMLNDESSWNIWTIWIRMDKIWIRYG